MNKDDYIDLLEGLGFYCQDGSGNRLPVSESYNLGRILRHDEGHVPSIYFGGPESDPYFTVRLEEWRYFPADLWDEIDLRPGGYPAIINLIPNPRAARRAIQSLRPTPPL